MIKEKEIDAPGDALGKCLGGLSFSSLTWATATVENDKVAVGESDPSEYDEVVTTKDTETIDAFSSHMLYMWEWGWLTLERGSMWWLRPYMLRMGPYPRA